MSPQGCVSRFSLNNDLGEETVIPVVDGVVCCVARCYQELGVEDPLFSVKNIVHAHGVYVVN